jgi:hypothetical protein
MMKFLGFAGVCLLTLASVGAVLAQERETLGIGILSTNDALGDGVDRWRTGSLQVSVLRGPSWTGTLGAPGAVMEYRFRGEIVGPDNLFAPAAGDRPYVGALWAGAHGHFDWVGFDATAGVDIVVVGEQTGLRNLQSGIHDLLSLPSINVEAVQIANGTFLHGTLEVARDIAFAGGAIRPFVELQAGVHDLARAGMDVTFGSFGEDGLRLRNPATGQRIQGITAPDDRGLSLLLGGDWAYVSRSAFLPASSGVTVEDAQYRLRAGVNYGLGAANIFYGLTYLSEEFTGQSEGQVVGSVTLSLLF